jgi:hypothetical protein
MWCYMKMVSWMKQRIYRRAILRSMIKTIILLLICCMSPVLKAQAPFVSSKQSLLLSNAQSGASERWAAIFFPSSATANYRLILPAIAPTVGQILNVANTSGNDATLQWTDITGTAWSLSGNAPTSSWNGTAGSFLGTTNAQPLSIATRNATAQDIRFYTGANGASERMRINSTGEVGVGKTATSGLTLDVQGRLGILTASGNNLFISGGNSTLSGTFNTIVGTNAMSALTSGSGNVGYGSGVLNNTTIGNDNTAVGGSALNGNISGNSNTAVGSGAQLIGSGSNNSSVGVLSLSSLTNGSNNVALGRSALAGVSSGGTNIGIGYEAGDNITTGSNNIVIGSMVDAPNATASNQLNIGNIIYGTGVDGAGTTVSSGAIGIGVASPVAGSRLDTRGNLALTNAGTASEIRLYEPSASGTNYTAFRTKAQVANITYTLPDADGVIDGDVLATDGAGNLRWVSIGSSTRLNNISSADGTSNINHSNYFQQWRWDGLTSNTAFTLSSNSTAATGNTQTILNVAMSGANATATQTTYAAQISNTHTGTSSTNVGLSVSASGGTNNYALIVPSGNVGIGTTTPGTDLHVNNAGASGSIWLTRNNLVSSANAAVITIDNSGDVSFFNNNNQTLRFGTNAVERIRIDNTGNVGIGVTAPGSVLDVLGSNDNGDIRLSAHGASNASEIRFRRSNGTSGSPTSVVATNKLGEIEAFGYGSTGWSSAGRAGFGMFASQNWTNTAQGTYIVFSTTADGTIVTSERMRIDNAGNVGLGTTVPTARLHVNGSSRFVGGNLLIDTSAGSTAGQLQLMNPARTFQTNIRAGAQTANITYTLPTTAPTAGQVLSSDASGNMSWATALTSSSGWSTTGNASTTPSTNYIGTTDAQAFVIRTNAVERARFANGNTLNFGIQGSASTIPPASFTIGSAGWVSASTANNQAGTNTIIQAGPGTGTGSPGYISMQVPASGASGTAVQSSSEMMRINGTGVLVGGASGTMPNYRLQVDANSGGQAYANFTTGSGSGTASTDGLIVGLQNDNTNALVWNQENGYVRFGTNNAERVRIDNAGNVGIGTATPGELLDIAGDMRLTNQRTRSMQRTIPTTVGQAVDIGTFTLTNGGGSFWISITVPSSSFSVSKQYLIPITWNQTNNVWFVAQPSQTTGSYGGNDYDLDVNSSSGSFSLRLRRSLGTTAGTAYIVIRQEGINTDAFTASTTVNTVSAPSSTLYATLSSTALSAITAATATNSINSSNFGQTWQWNTLAGTSALTLSTTSTAAAGNAQTLLNLSMSGANSTTSQTTFGAQINNTHTGTSSTNVGLSVSASGGTNNYGLLVPNGNVGIGTTIPSYRLDINGGDFRLVNNSSYLRTWGETDIEYDGGPDGLMAFRNNANINGKTRFWNASSASLLTIQNNGNIGINTESPSQMLHVVNGNILIDNNDNNARELRFDEPSSSGTNYTAFRAQAQANNITYTLPASDGASGASLTTNGSGALSWSPIGMIQFARKTADESVTNSNAMQDDDNLSMSIGANETWEVEFMLRATGGGGDIKYAISLPTGSSMWVTARGDDQASSQDDYIEMVTPGTEYTFTSNGNWELNPAGAIIHLKGIVVTSGTSGTMQLRWAQRNSNGTPTVIRAFSYLKATRMQ